MNYVYVCTDTAYLVNWNSGFTYPLGGALTASIYVYDLNAVDTMRC